MILVTGARRLCGKLDRSISGLRGFADPGTSSTEGTEGDRAARLVVTSLAEKGAGGNLKSVGRGLPRLPGVRTCSTDIAGLVAPELGRLILSWGSPLIFRFAIAGVRGDSAEGKPRPFRRAA